MQSIWLDADASKGISEEVAKAIDVSLNQIDTYHNDGGRKILLVNTEDSGGGGVIESLAIELKNIGCISFFCSIVNCFLHVQYKSLQKSVEQVYGAGDIGEVFFIQLFHTFWSTKEALDEYFKETWVRVNPYYLMPFMSDITNE